MLTDVLQRLDLGLPRSRERVALAMAMAAAHTPGASIALIDGGAIAETVSAGVLEAGAGQQPLRLHPRGDGRWTSSNLTIDAWFDNSTLVIEQDGAQERLTA